MVTCLICDEGRIMVVGFNPKPEKMKLFPAPSIWKQARFPDCRAYFAVGCSLRSDGSRACSGMGVKKVSDVDSRSLCWIISGRGWWGKLIHSQPKCSALPQPCSGVWGHLLCVLPPCCFTPAPTTAILLRPARASLLLGEQLLLLGGEITR